INKNTGASLAASSNFPSSALYQLVYTEGAYKVYNLTSGASGGTDSSFNTITVSALDASTTASTAKPYYISDIGKEGFFYYAGTVANQSTDNGGTVIVTSDLKQFKRSYDGVLRGRWFGMVADNSTDNVSAIN